METKSNGMSKCLKTVCDEITRIIQTEVTKDPLLLLACINSLLLAGCRVSLAVVRFAEHVFCACSSLFMFTAAHIDQDYQKLRSTGSISGGSFQIHFSPKPLKI